MVEDKDKKTFKEKRKDRQQKRVDKLTEERKSEADKFAVDIGPLGAERKANIDKAMQEGVSEDMLGGLKKIQDLRQPPTVDLPKPVSDGFTIKDVRKERRAKIADILGSLGSGLSGENVDPTKFRDKLKDERLSQYEQYRDISRRAKGTLDKWQGGYIDEQLDYLNKLKKDPNTTEKERLQIDKMKQQLRYETARASIAEREARSTGKGITSDKPGRISYKTSRGETLSGEATDTELMDKINKDYELKQELQVLDDKISEYTGGLEQLNEKLKVYDYKEDLSDIEIATRNAVQKFIRDLQKSINDVEAQKQSVLGRDEIKPQPTQGESKPTPETPIIEGESDFLNIVNKYK